MIGPVSRIVTGLATRQVARALGGAAAGPGAGVAGMAVGLALPFMARTLGPAGMVGLAVGGWAVKRVIEKRSKPGGPVKPALKR